MALAVAACSGPDEAPATAGVELATTSHALTSGWRWPLPGTINRDWVINNYVDLDNGFQVVRDYRGGDRSYDGHRGIDIDVASMRASDAGFPVLAVTAGQVVDLGEDQPDRHLSSFCQGFWNYVAVRTPDGSLISYGHLRKDSVVVTVGQNVQAGATLGVVGSSGCSTQAHLHLETIDANFQLVDPFLAGLWQNPPAYDARLSFMDAVVTDLSSARRDFMDPRPNVVAFAQGSPLSFFAHTGGGLAGDRILGRVRRPNGSTFASQQYDVDGPIRHWVFGWSFPLDANAPVGTWKTEILVNGATTKTTSFNVTAGRTFYDDFTDDELGSIPTGWNTSGGSWSVTRGDDMTGDGGYTSLSQTVNSPLPSRSWAATVPPFTDQVARARGRLDASFGSNATLSLLGRVRDIGNYYEAAVVTNPGSATAQIVRRAGGVSTLLRTAPIAPSGSGIYDLRLEAIGSGLRFFVNDALVAWATDGTHAAGTVGVGTDTAAASFGQVKLSTPTASAGALLFLDDFEAGNTAKWSLLSGSWSVITDGSKVLRQSNTSGDQRAATTGATWGDQAVSARVKPTAFNGNDKFVAVLARLQNASNYYYAALRSSGKLEIKKVVGGASSTIASKPYAIATNTWYGVRLEVSGSVLRLFVDGVLQLSGVDTKFTSGRAGLATQAASAVFDDVTVALP